MEGLETILRNMRELTAKTRRKAVRKAVGKGAAVIRKKAKDNALRVDDKGTGRQIATNVGQRFRSRYFRQTGDTMISIGVLTNRGRIPRGNPDEGARGNTPHWHLVELGTEQTRAQPFLRPAASSSLSSVFNAVASELERQVAAETAKLGSS